MFADAEVAVVLDMQNEERLGRLRPYLSRPGVTVAILDHHVGTPSFGHVHVVLPEKAATGELVYDLVRRTPGALTRPMAEALYTALVTDTGSFRHSNTDPDVHCDGGAACSSWASSRRSSSRGSIATGTWTGCASWATCSRTSGRATTARSRGSR